MYDKIIRIRKKRLLNLHCTEVKRVAWPPTAAAAAAADSYENNNSDYATTPRTEKHAPPVPPKPNRNSHQVNKTIKKKQKTNLYCRSDQTDRRITKPNIK